MKRNMGKVNMHNKELAKIFHEMAACYSYLGPEHHFRATAYNKASKLLANMSVPVDTFNDNIKELDTLPGVGESIAEKIVEYLHTGKIAVHEKLKEQVPFELLELMDIGGIGPASIRQLHTEMGIRTKQELVMALEKNGLDNVKGFTADKIAAVRRVLKIDTKAKKQMLLKDAAALGNKLCNEIEKIPGVIQVVLAGSLRRKKRLVGDIDIVITAPFNKRKKIMHRFLLSPMLEKKIAAGETKASVLLKPDNIQADIRIVQEHEFGAALLYFTGSREHTIKLRTIAKAKGLKLNEYGIFDSKTGKRLAGETEEGIYELLGFKYISPENRVGEQELK